jgi:hypothetical protein
MRLIDADELMECYENSPKCNIDDYYVSIPVVRQNILDMPTINPYDWISVEDRLPDIDPCGKGRYGGTRSVRVLCTCKQRDGRTFVKEGYYEPCGNGNVFWRIPGSIDSVTHWMPLPEPPENERSLS